MLNNIGGNDLLFNIDDKLNENNYVTYEGSSELTGQMGKVWEKVDINANFPNTNSTYSMAVNPNGTIVLMQAYHLIYYSADWGKTWSQSTTPSYTTQDGYRCCRVLYADHLDKFVLAVYRDIFTSTDGKTWTKTYTFSNYVDDIAYANNTLLVTKRGQVSKYAWVSTNATSWTNVNAPFAYTEKIIGIKDAFFTTTTTYYYWSSDGKTWTQCKGFIEWDRIFSVGYNKHLGYVALVGYITNYSGDKMSAKIYASQDKTNWTQVGATFSLDGSTDSTYYPINFENINSLFDYYGRTQALTDPDEEFILFCNQGQILYVDTAPHLATPEELKKSDVEYASTNPIYKPDEGIFFINSWIGYFESKNTYTATGDLQIGGKSFLSLPIKISESGSGTQIATGTYTGTGRAGSSAPCSLTFNFKPKLVLISANAQQIFEGKGAIFISPQSMACTIGGTSSGSTHGGSKLTWTDTSVTWYDTYSESDTQLNTSGTIYYYWAIG